LCEPRQHMAKTIRAAVVQAASVGFDAAATVEKAGEWMARGAAAGAQLAVFPEAFIGGYPRGSAFGAVVGRRSDEGREWFRRYAAGAIAAPGRETERLGELARKHGLYVVIGVIERGGSTLYCTVLFFAPDGALLGKHRKLMPTVAEPLVWGCGDGSTMPVLETPLGRLGAAICWENYMPMYRMHLYSRGVDLYCAPAADTRDSWQATVRHIAAEGRCFVLSANQYVRRGDLPAGFPVAMEGDVLSRGGSVIVDPLGSVLAGPDFANETLLVADLDLDAIPRAWFDFDVAGHYARPDVFRLVVDTGAKDAVVEMEPGNPSMTPPRRRFLAGEVDEGALHGPGAEETPAADGHLFAEIKLFPRHSRRQGPQLL